MSAVDPRTKTTIRIDNLDPALDLETLHAAFIPFGEIVEVEMPMTSKDKNDTTVSHRGFAHIQYEEPEDAAAAIDNMDNAELYERTLRVQPAKAMREAQEGLGSKIPLWQQEAFIQKYMVGQEGKEEAVNSSGVDAMEGVEQQAQQNFAAQGELPIAVGPKRQ